MANRLRYLRDMPEDQRVVFDARLRQLAEANRTMRQAAAVLGQEYPDYLVTYDTVLHLARRFDIRFKGHFASTAPQASGDQMVDSVVRQERDRLRQQELARELQQLQRTEAKRQQYIDTIRSCLETFQPTELIPLPFARTENPEHYWGLLFSDWHTGQKTPIQATGGVYEQTTEVTRWQVERMLHALRSIHAVEAQSQLIRKLLVVFDGDLLENDSMRAAQARKVDLLVTQQAVEIYDLMGYALRQLLLLPGVEEIEVHNVGGNHDRTSSRAGLAGLGELDYVDTYAWLVGQLLARAFEDEPRVRFTNWETFFGYTTFAERRVIFEHGSSFRYGTGSYGGVPWYPIVNAANKLVEMLGGGDLVLFGHIHKPAVLPIGQDGWLVVNGALPATSEYIQSTFKSVRVPTQWLIDLHEEHGVVDFRPLYAPPEGLLQVGEIWA